MTRGLTTASKVGPDPGSSAARPGCTHPTGMIPADEHARRLGSMVFSRLSIVLAMLSSAVLLAGCGGSDTASDSGPSGTASATTQDAVVTWADGVCSASADLLESVRSVGALQIDSSGSQTSLDHARAQVRDGVQAVQGSAKSLNQALADVPAEANPELTAARDELQAASERAHTAVDQLAEAASGVADAQSASAMATSLVALKAAATGTANDLAAYLQSLRGTLTGGGQAVQDAFAAAPACQKLTT